MKINSEVLDLIKEHEGLKNRPYIDPLVRKELEVTDPEFLEKLDDIWSDLNITIGYGRCLETNPLSTYECEVLLKEDLQEKYHELDLAVSLELNIDFQELPPGVQNVLLNMSYQLGVGGLLKFKKTLDHVKGKHYISASAEMLNSKWAKQTPNRAKTLSNLMKGGY